MTKGEVIWKAESKFHVPYLVCMCVQVHRMAVAFTFLFKFVFLHACHYVYLLLCLRTEHCKTLVRTALSCALERPCTYVSKTVESPQNTDLSEMTWSTSEWTGSSVLLAGQTHASSWPASFGKLESCIIMALCPSEYKKPLRRVYLLNLSARRTVVSQVND